MPYHNSPINHQIKELERKIAKTYKEARRQIARDLAHDRIHLLELRLEREQELKIVLGAPNNTNIELFKQQIREQRKLLK